ncbi:MAG: hypothetical protein R3208_16790 [Ketobacteraceae bacterium]|nr:hypothetical protein [Ketobacteraceae bacterium]
MIPQTRVLAPKNLIVDLLRMTPQRSVSSKALVDTAELFNFNENAIRVTLTRLVSKGVLESDARGYYRLAKKTDPISRYIEDWRLGEERRQPEWDRTSWLMCHLPKKPQRSARSRSLKALKFLGFREGMDNVWVRPANLRYDFTDIDSLLAHLELEPAASLMQSARLKEGIIRRWQHQLWNTKSLDYGYREGIRKIEASLKKLPKLSNREAMAETFIVGGEAIHILVKDPWLPDDIFATDERARLHEKMLHYDEVGREIWSKEVKHLQVKVNPRHLRLVK